MNGFVEPHELMWANYLSPTLKKMLSGGTKNQHDRDDVPVAVLQGAQQGQARISGGVASLRNGCGTGTTETLLTLPHAKVSAHHTKWRRRRRRHTAAGLIRGAGGGVQVAVWPGQRGEGGL